MLNRSSVEERSTDHFRCSLGHQEEVRGQSEQQRNALLIISGVHLVIRDEYVIFSALIFVCLFFLAVVLVRMCDTFSKPQS
ncbi:hypothetical protein FRC18_010525 [Serendipita sp. 400]|nr:hypothetical protein FRC18_010525 [Serendipita sp. 400]